MVLCLIYIINGKAVIVKTEKWKIGSDIRSIIQK